jgi:outer membrane protein OmpA-like peptidoglycan-associated protein
MTRQPRHRLAGLAAAASLQVLLAGGTALAQPAAVHIFEEAPPLEVLRSIMVPESRPGGATRRIVIGAPPERPASMVTQAAVAMDPLPDPAEEPTAATPRRRPQPRWQPQWQPQPQPQPQQPMAAEPGPVLASARIAAPALPEPRPAAMPAPEATPGSIGFRINFALNSDVVPGSAYAFVERVGELLRDQPQLRIRVEGHTDALGSDEYNLLLSQRRAAAVAEHLVRSQGIDPARLVVLGYGESAPLTGNAHDPRNRRVQFARVD